MGLSDTVCSRNEILTEAGLDHVRPILMVKSIVGNGCAFVAEDVCHALQTGVLFKRSYWQPPRKSLASSVEARVVL